MAACNRLRFWVDIMALFPFDYIIIEAAFPRCFADNTARYWSLLKILRLVRRYHRAALRSTHPVESNPREPVLPCTRGIKSDRGRCYAQLRMYRVLIFFKVLEYNLSVGLLVSTLVRNATVSAVLCCFLCNAGLGTFPCRALAAFGISWPEAWPLVLVCNSS